MAGLWSLAIAWPVFQRLDAGSETLTLVEARGMDLLAFTVLVALLAPTVLLTIELLLLRFTDEKAARAFHAVVLGVLAGIVVWQVAQTHSVIAMIAFFVVLVVFAIAYLRLDLVRNFALILGIATPVVLVLFLSSYPIRAEVLPGKPAMDAQSTTSRTPVVMIVLDELPLPFLLDREGELDEKLLPELKPLRRDTTWYPRTLSVGDQTLSALPAIMTGEDAASGEDRPPPGLPGYPDNLCSITADAGFIVRAQETITDLCPRASGLKLRLSDLLRLGLAPDQTADGHSKRITPGGLLEDAATKVTDRYPVPPSVYGLDRPAYARGFTAGLARGPRTFDLLHLILPHAPFQFLADGSGYPSLVIGDTGTQKALEDPESGAETLKHMQQNLAQTRFALKLVNEVIDRMKALGVWDQSLFVVTADHGASFKVGASRRTIREENDGWLLPVPLFIKYPGQTEGKVDRRYASSKDIAPTVLGVLGLKPSPRATGRSLLEDPGGMPVPKQLEVTSTDEKDFTFDLDQVEESKREAVALKARGFGSGTLFAPGGDPGLLGQKVRGDGEWESVDAEFQSGGPKIEGDPSSPFQPVYVQAVLPNVKSDPGTIAVSINWKVAATTRAWKRDGVWMTGVNIPASALKKGENFVGLYKKE